MTAFLKRLYKRYTDYRTIQHTHTELLKLTPRELQDIGLSRSMIITRSALEATLSTR